MGMDGVESLRNTVPFEKNFQRGKGGALCRHLRKWVDEEVVNNELNPVVVRTL